MKVWMRVSLDRFRLPVAVANSAAELAVICGTTENCVKSCASHFKHVRKDAKKNKDLLLARLSGELASLKRQAEYVEREIARLKEKEGDYEHDRKGID